LRFSEPTNETRAENARHFMPCKEEEEEDEVSKSTFGGTPKYD
jgi:hypothetical protein